MFALSNAQLLRLDDKVTRGPPGLWKLTEQVAKHAEDLQQSKVEVQKSNECIEKLERSLQETRGVIGHQTDLQKTMQQDSHDFQVCGGWVTFVCCEV